MLLWQPPHAYITANYKLAARQWKQGLPDDTAEPERSDEHSPLLPPAPIADDKMPQIFRLLGQRRLLVALLVTLVGASTFSAFETVLTLHPFWRINKLVELIFPPDAPNIRG